MEARDPRRRWDERYTTAREPGPPAGLLLDWLEHLPRGRALDIACGAGANTLLLAERGVGQVFGVDISPVALKIAARAARRRRLSVHLLAADVTVFPLPFARFDTICVFRFLERSLAPRLVAALRPGGVLIYETFTLDQLAFGYGPRSASWLLRPGELPGLFAKLSVLHYAEGVRDEHGRPAALAALVARREATPEGSQ